MKHLNKFNESKTLNNKLIEDINELISNLEYLKSFVQNNIEDDDLKFFSKINTTHTDIQLLSNKIKRPK